MVTVNALRKILKAAGVSCNGNKQALVNRCQAHGLVYEDTAAPATPTMASTAARSSLAPAPVGTAEIVAARLDAEAPAAIAALAAVDPAPSHIGGVPLLVMEPMSAHRSSEMPGATSTLVARSPAGGPTGLSGNSSRPATTAEATAAEAPTSAAARTAVTAPAPVTDPLIGSARSSPITKHEVARLCHVMAKGEVAAGVVVSRGPMSRMQQDARSRRGAVWVDVVAPAFNCSETFDVPATCKDMEHNPNVHPIVRTGERLQAKWTEVRFFCAAHAFWCVSLHFIGVFHVFFSPSIFLVCSEDPTFQPSNATFCFLGIFSSRSLFVLTTKLE